MLEFGLTGGIGSGKSTVSSLLAKRGAVIIDADAIVRDLQRPGELVFDAMVARWGNTIIADDGTLARGAVAEIVFSDDDELAALNGIVHPAVAGETERLLNEAEESGATVVVHDIPLLVLPGGELLTSRDHTDWAGIVVVDTPLELAIDRVIAARGMDRDDIVARMDAQASREDRRAAADYVIDNSGDLEDLEAAVEQCWAWMQSETRNADGAAATTAAHTTATGLDELSGAEDNTPAHTKPTGLDESSGAEDHTPAHTKPTGLDESSGAEDNTPAHTKSTGLADPSDAGDRA